jgi:DNA primase
VKNPLHFQSICLNSSITASAVGAHGSAISFLMEHLGLPFPEAVEQLASQQGIEVPYEKTDAAEVEQRSRQLTLVERMNHCARLL